MSFTLMYMLEKVIKHRSSFNLAPPPFWSCSQDRYSASLLIRFRHICYFVDEKRLGVTKNNIHTFWQGDITVVFQRNHRLRGGVFLVTEITCIRAQFNMIMKDMQSSHSMDIPQTNCNRNVFGGKLILSVCLVTYKKSQLKF